MQFLLENENCAPFLFFPVCFCRISFIHCCVVMIRSPYVESGKKVDSESNEASKPAAAAAAAAALVVAGWPGVSLISSRSREGARDLIHFPSVLPEMSINFSLFQWRENPCTTLQVFV